MKFKLSNFPPTEKQLELIADIEEFVTEQFNGNTFDEARDYIDRNYERFRLEIMENWQYQYM